MKSPLKNNQFINKRFKSVGTLTAGAIFTLVAFAGTNANAQLIDVDINGQGSSATQTGAAVLGSSGDIWNGLGGSSTTLNDSTGTAVTGVSLTISGNANSGANDPGGSAMDTATTPLMQDYLYPNGGSTTGITLTVNGLTAYAGDSFTFVIYAAGDGAGQGANLVFDDGATSSAVATSVIGTSTVTDASTTGVSRQLSAGEGVAYQEFTGTVAADGILSVNGTPSDASPYTAFNGFQLEIGAAPEPQVWAMLGLGLVGLAAFQYRRNRFN
jgi:hypothetical protein